MMDFIKKHSHSICLVSLTTAVVASEIMIAYSISKALDRQALARCNTKQIEKAQHKLNATIASLSSIAKLEQLPTDLLKRLNFASIQSLQEGLSNGEFTCEQILIAYLNRLKSEGIISRLFNEVSVEKALSQARKLDEEFKSGRKRGPFHGIPIGISDTVSIKDMPITRGLSKYAYSMQEHDALIVEAMREAGAIIFVTGAIPQNKNSLESINYATGQAVSPFNRKRTPGSGLAGLIANGCCSFGVSAELINGIKIPAHFCALYGLRPTSKRVSKLKTEKILQVFPVISEEIGPIGRSTDDCALFMQVACSDFVFRKDPYVVPFAWSQELYTDKRKLKIGYIDSNDYWPLPKCIERALELTKTYLEGHEFIKIALPNLEKLNELLISIIENEKEMPIGEPLLLREKITKAKSWWSQLKKKFTKNKDSFYARGTRLNDAYDYVKNLIEVTKIKNEFFRTWNEAGVDVIIAPFPVPAMLHDSSVSLYPGFIYANFFNLLDCPCGSVPVTSVFGDEQFYEETGESWTKEMNRNMKESENLPISVQVIAPPYKEELCLNVMKQIEGKFPLWKKVKFAS